MLDRTSPLVDLAHALAQERSSPVKVARECAQRANGNASHNTYLHFDESELREQAEQLSARYAVPASRPGLFGVPISLKDCFDLKGTVTTCGTRFYAEQNAEAAEDSAIAARLRAAGAIITGKTHLHPLAYGITGENPDYGDCVQPRDAALLTGGSSSGAAASVQEGSALAAIGTDTGGSVRVPAALCGLAGYRASHSVGFERGIWRGGVHLAPTFDTVGLLTRDARDLAPIAHVLFGVAFAPVPKQPCIGYVEDAFLFDCETDVLEAFDLWRARLSAQAKVEAFDAGDWSASLEIFAGIQAHEAAKIHRGHFGEFEPLIAQRLEWGASLAEDAVEELRMRMAAFRCAMDALFERFDLLMLPCAPVSRLVEGVDHSKVRPRILRYTTPFSLAGLPAVALPGEMIGAGKGTGVQIAAAPGGDAMLLAFASALMQGVIDESA